VKANDDCPASSTNSSCPTRTGFKHQHPFIFSAASLASSLPALPTDSRASHGRCRSSQLHRAVNEVEVQDSTYCGFGGLPKTMPPIETGALLFVEAASPRNYDTGNLTASRLPFETSAGSAWGRYPNWIDVLRAAVRVAIAQDFSS
jgi:hypothetical protein